MSSASSAARLDRSRRPGSRVGDNLVLVRALGRGAMGEVWLARHDKLKHEVAIKFLKGDGVGGTLGDVQLERFQFEGQVAARLAGHSRHIVAVHDTGTTGDGEPYLVMEYVRGTTLERAIDEGGAMDGQRVAAIVEQIAGVLELAHERGVIHRDLKPANIMMIGDGESAPNIKVADFGVAKILARDHDLDAPTPTHEGFLVGSPAYMSPEQLTGACEPDRDADLWALSVVAYEALTGWAPFGGNTISALTLAVCRETHDRVTAHDPNLPGSLDAFFERALAKDPGERFKSAAELSQAFRAAVEHEASGAAGGSLIAWSRGRRAPILAAVATFATLGGIAWLALRSEDPAARAAPPERAQAGERVLSAAELAPGAPTPTAPSDPRPPDPQPPDPLAVEPPGEAGGEHEAPSTNQAPGAEPVAAQPSPPTSAASTPKLMPPPPAKSEELIPAPPSFDESETL